MPERLYLESKWASLMSYGMTTRLLEDTLPLEGKIHVDSVRNHAYRSARRLEKDLAIDSKSHRIEAEQWPQDNIPPPKPRITVGLDGGYIRARDAPSPREGWFEAITGKSSVEDGGSKCFAFVQRVDRQAESRMCRIFKGQGMVYHQPVTFVSDGGETVRCWPSRLHPGAEHVLDWFHITMRLTVLQQMAKSIAIPDVDGRALAEEPATLLTSAKWLLWHGNVHRALDRLDELVSLIEHDDRIPKSPERRKLSRMLNEFYNYIDSNRNLIPDYGDRRQHGEAIASSVAESTVNQVISHRFVKKQQMRWQPENAHLLLHLRTSALNNDLRATFERWYPGLTPSAAPAFG
ncbi:MAG: ISKra4 family transposase [Steroidobacteraceae bacterium]